MDGWRESYQRMSNFLLHFHMDDCLTLILGWKLLGETGLYFMFTFSSSTHHRISERVPTNQQNRLLEEETSPVFARSYSLKAWENGISQYENHKF